MIANTWSCFVSSEDENPLEIEIEVALAEYMVKCDQGQAPDREVFLARHPQLRDKLSEILAAADWIEQLAGPTLADIAGNSTSQRSSGAGAPWMVSDPTTDETLPHPSFP
jgi:hypothetical protein